MIELSSIQTRMNEKAKMLMKELEFITPLNVHVKTDAPVSVKDSFHSVWFNHTPSAARLMLLPYLYDGRVNLTT